MTPTFAGRFAGIFLAVLLCGACASRSTAPTSMPPAPMPPAATAIPAPAQAILLRTTGEVTLQRNTWTKMVPTTGVTLLFAGDQIRVGPDGHARLLCPDFETIVEPPPGSVVGATAGCPQETEPLVIDGQRALPARLLTREDHPYILAPRFTRVLDANPELSWNPVANVMTYTVSLRDPELISNQVLWTRTVQSTTVRYDGTPLEPEKRYWVEVTDGTTTEQSEFRIASLAARRTLAARITQLEQKLSDPLERAVVVAVLYSSEGLYADALRVLEPVAGSAPGVLALQGQLVMAMKWDSRAYTTYEALREQVNVDTDPALLVEATAWSGHLMPPDPDVSASAYAAARKELFLQASEIARNVLGDEARAESLKLEQP